MTLSQTRTILFFVVLLLVAAGTSRMVSVSTLKTGAGSIQPQDAAQIVSLLPDSIEAVVMYSGESDPFATDAGRAFMLLLDDAGLTEQTNTAWDELAVVLELTPEEAFDELLGRRVILVAQNIDHAKNRQWAIISEIGPKTEYRLRKRLKPAARGNKSGLPVFGLEDGRFSLTIGCVLGPHTHKTSCRKHRVEHGATILLASSDHGAVFDSLLPLLAGKVVARSLEGSQAAGQIAKLGQGDAFVLLRSKANSQGPENELPFVAAIAKFHGQTINAQITASPTLIWSDRIIKNQPRPTADLAFESLSDGALAAVIQVVDNESHARTNHAMLSLSKLLALPGQENPLGGRVALAIHEQGVGAENQPRMTFTFAAETDDVDATAIAGDRFLCHIASLASTRKTRKSHPELLASSVLPGQREPMDFNGTLPQAVRTIAISGSLKKKLKDLCGGLPSISWVFSQGHERVQSKPKAGWWVAQLHADDRQGAEAHTNRLRQVSNGLSRGCAAKDAPRRVSIGMLRPARLGELFTSLSESRILAPMKWIDEVSWDAAIGDDGFIDASLTIRMLQIVESEEQGD